MARGSWCWTTAVVALLLGCTSPEGAAQDEGAPATRPTPAEAAEADDEEEDGSAYRALVVERGTSEPFVVADAVLFVPEVSLFGAGGGSAQKELILRRGAAEIEIPFRRIAGIAVGEEKEDRLEVVVVLRPKEGAPGEPIELAGTVKSSLELRGTYADSDLATVVRLRQVQKVDLNRVE